MNGQRNGHLRNVSQVQGDDAVIGCLLYTFEMIPQRMLKPVTDEQEALIELVATLVRQLQLYQLLILAEKQAKKARNNNPGKSDLADGRSYVIGKVE